MLLLRTFLFISVFASSALAVQEISQEDIDECASALIKMSPSKSHNSDEGKHHSDYHYFNDDNAEIFKYFWHKNPTNTPILKTFAEKIHAIKKQGDLNVYESRLINAIFSFMLEMRDLIEKNKIDSNALPDYIQKIIDSLEKFSPTEMFIHARIIEISTKQLGYTHKIDFRYHEHEVKELFEDISNVLQSREQRKYSISQNETNQAIAKTSQNSHLKEDEWQMRYKGYNKSYVRGFDHIRSSLSLVQTLRKRFLNNRFINPYTTHIPWFANLIDTHIRSIEISIASQNSPDKTERLKLLNLLKAEAKSYKMAEMVTYQWWLNFNLRLSILVTPREHRNKSRLLDIIEDTGELIKKGRLEILYLESIYNKHSVSKEMNEDNDLNLLFRLINAFPEKIMIPIVYDLGIISINTTYGTGVSFIRLKSDPTDIKGNLMYPDDIFIYDVHNYIANKNIDNKSQLFHPYFQRKLRTLTIPEREAVEYIYFQLNYEDFSFSEIINFKNPITNTKSAQYDNDYTHLLHFILKSQTDRATEFINRGEKTIIRLISEINEELCIMRRSLLPNLSEEQMTTLHYLMADTLLKN